MESKKVKLHFLGQVYYLAGSTELEEVVRYVEELARRIQGRYPDLPSHRLVVLMVLELAEQLLELRKGFDGYKTGVEEEVRRLTERIDEILGSIGDIA